MTTIHKRHRQVLPEFLRSPGLPGMLIMSALAIGLAALLPLVQSSIATTTNGNIHSLERERDDWRARVEELELDAATMAGLERIEQMAKTGLKMVEPKDTRYITVAVEPPAARTLPSRYLPPIADERPSEPSIWGQVLGWLSIR